MSGKLLAAHPVLAARDVAVSVRFFEALGFTLSFLDNEQSPRYAALCRDLVELHLQWADPGQWIDGLDRPAYRILVDDVDALHRAWTASGGVNTHSSNNSPWAAPADTPWGTREFHLCDPADNSLQFYRPR